MLAATTEELHALRSEMHRLEQVRQQLSHFGELEDFHAEYLTRFRTPQTIERIKVSLDGLEQRLKDRLNFRLARFSAVLGVLFGIIGSGQIADSVFEPLRKGGSRIPILFGLPSKLSDLLLAASMLSLIALGIWYAMGKLKRPA